MSHVSIIIPTWNRAELLRTRSIPSVLAQTYEDWDLHVVGDGSPDEVAEAVASFTDPRIRFTNRPRYEYPPDALDAWHIAGSANFNHGLDTAAGPLVCGLGDDDEWLPTYLERMVAKIESGYDLVYCVSEVVVDGKPIGYLGCEFPPRFAGQSGGEFLWRLDGTRLNLDCWRDGTPNDWDLIRRLVMSGMRVGWLRDFVGYRYHPGNHIPPVHRTPPQ